MLSKIITAKLKENRRIVIPGMGVFIMREDGRILFSELMHDDDGVLRHALAEHNEIDDKEAAHMIEHFVTELRDTLNRGVSYRIEGLGALSLDDRGIAVFKDREEEMRHVAERSTRDMLNALLADDSRAESERRKTAARIAEEEASAQPEKAASTEKRAEAPARRSVVEPVQPAPQVAQPASQPVQPVPQPEPKTERPAHGQIRRKTAKRRRKTDSFLIIAIMIALLAIGVIACVLWMESRNEDSPIYEYIQSWTTEQTDNAAVEDDYVDLTAPSKSL